MYKDVRNAGLVGSIDRPKIQESFDKLRMSGVELA